MNIRCYWLEPTARLRVFLRRYASGSSCGVDGNQGYHQAWVPIEDRPARLSERGTLLAEEAIPGEDRWPPACACGYEFTDPGDIRQVFIELFYRRADTGEELTLRDSPPGAMWNARWLHDHPQYPGPDGQVLVVKTPAGEWTIDGPSEPNGKHWWTREGTPPLITVRPSVKIYGPGPNGSRGEYHALLTNGELVDA